MSLIRLSPWRQVPLAPVVRRGHFAAPVSQSEGVWLPGISSSNLHTKSPPVSRSQSLKGSPYGPVADFSSQYIDTGIANTVASTGVTMIVLVKGTGAPTSSPPATGPLYHGGAGIVWHHSNASYRGSFFIKGSGTYPVVSFGTLSANVWYVLGGTASSAGMYSYRNGELISSTLSGWGTSADAGGLMIAKHPTNADYFSGQIAFCLKLDRALSDAQMRALGTPMALWDLFEPRRIWVPVSAGSGTQTLTPDLFTNNNTFYTHTVTTGAVTLTPDLFTNTNSFYTPTVSSSYTVTPDLFTNTNTFYTPVVTNLSTLYPDLFTNSQTFYTHVVTGGGGQTLEPELFSNSATFYGPTITVGSVTLTASLFTNTNDIYTHTVTSNYPLTPDLFSNSSSFYTPTISVGAVTLTPSLFTNSNTFYTHTISNSSTTIYFWKRTA